jgi:hypothetical protein
LNQTLFAHLSASHDAHLIDGLVGVQVDLGHVAQPDQAHA